MPGIQTSNGKAFEYACLCALFDTLGKSEEIALENSPQVATARHFFQSMPPDAQEKFMRAAQAAVRVIVRLEPQLQYAKDNTPLCLSLQADAKGIAGDVRDVLCSRKQNGWQMGLSCKHNHHAVKHSRLSDTIDFGREWFQIPCSKQYFCEVVPLFAKLRRMRDEARKTGGCALWSEIPDKAQTFYIPILTSFLKELNRLASTDPKVPGLLIAYLLGRYDFYKVIADDRHEITRVEAINISGTLNRPSAGKNRLSILPG